MRRPIIDEKSKVISGLLTDLPGRPFPRRLLSRLHGGVELSSGGTVVKLSVYGANGYILPSKNFKFTVINDSYIKGYVRNYRILSFNKGLTDTVLKKHTTVNIGEGTSLILRTILRTH